MTRNSIASTVIALAFASFAAGCSCSGDADGGGGPGSGSLNDLESITITPAETTLVIQGTAEATQVFTAEGTFKGGKTKDITEQVEWSLATGSTGLGWFDANEFHTWTDRGGMGHVLAKGNGIVATADVTIRLERTISIPPTTGDPLPDNVEALFTGDEAAERAPEAIYPNDEVVVPPNLGRMEVHWLKGAGDNTVFAVSFTNAVTDVTAYLRCERPAGVNPNGCIWEPSGDAWKWVAETNRGGNPVEIRVRGTTDAGGTFGVSDPIRVRFSRDDIDGTLYYWTTSGNTKIVRYDFGAAAGAATDVMGPMSNSAGKCVGCHAISHDGSKIMASAGGQGSGGLVLVDLNGPSVVADQSNGHVIQFGSFRPDGSELVGIYGDDQGHVTYDLILFDTRCDTANMATCGAPTGTISLGGREASHPEWSPNDDRIVYTDVGFHRTSQKPGAGAIGYVDRTQNGWSAAKTLVARADGKNRYSPTFAPDGSFVVYNESTCAGGNVASDDCDADSDPSAKIWGVSSEGGTPVALERATAPGALESTTDFQATFPRFTPFVFVLEDQELGGRRVMWLTYASRRNYGLRTHDGGLTTWLWMTAIDPDAVLSGDDGSFPAFALPFQDLTTSNHIGVWTTKAVGDPLLL